MKSRLWCVPGSGTLCASWQCLEVPRGPPPSLAVQFVGSGTSLSGMDVELVGSRYRMSLVKKRFATGAARTHAHTHTLARTHLCVLDRVDHASFTRLKTAEFSLYSVFSSQYIEK